MPLFLVADPAASTGLISIAIAANLVLDDGSFNRNTVASQKVWRLVLMVINLKSVLRCFKITGW
jgi:hypothetical protein